MRRLARASPSYRTRSISLNPTLSKLPPTEWPKRLRLASEILNNELELTDASSRQIIIESVATAQSCTQAINRRAIDISEWRTRNRAWARFVRITNSLTRAPANLRLQLDNSILALIRRNPVDLETIEKIFEATVTTCRQFPKSESARTILRAMSASLSPNDRTIGISSDYSALNPFYQRESERVLLSTIGKSHDKNCASDIFRALACVLAQDKSAKVNSGIAELIVNFVSEIAKLWLRAGLKPTRATRNNDRNYRSRFHRFVDLVLTAMVDPGSKRHDGKLDEMGAKLMTIHRSMSTEARDVASAHLRRSDVEWLVSDDHLKKALKPFQKNANDTP